MKRLIALFLLGFAPWCMGDPVVINYTSTCTDYCESVGLNLGDTVSGWVEFAWTGEDTLHPEDMLSFSFTFGDLDFTQLTAAASLFTATLLGDQVGSYSFRMADSTNSLRPGNIARLEPGIWSAVNTQGFCNETCDFTRMNNFASLDDQVVTYAHTPHTTHSVPEPGTFALMGIALLGLALQRRRA